MSGVGASTAVLPRSPIRLPAETPPHLLVVVDTEEEFDWGAPFDRGATSVSAMSRQAAAQEILERHGIVPTYVVDYPVAAQPAGYEALRDWQRSGSAEIGAHLHPWVTPPHDEEVNRRNSFPGNLPRELEAAKLTRLGDRIEQSFGSRASVYKAGRYGLGPRTAEILEEQGFEVDLSANPPYDYRDEGGPDYSGWSCRPYWFGRHRPLLGIPSTGAYAGWIRAGAHRLYRWATRPGLGWARLPGILSRLGAVDRLRLSPEGFDSTDLRLLTRALLARGHRLFCFSYHSPSLMPGCTPYVRSDSQLAVFLDRFRDYFDFFLGELGGRPTTPLALKGLLETEARSSRR